MPFQKELLLRNLRNIPLQKGDCALQEILNHHVIRIIMGNASDPIINKINGRTKRLKKLVFVEKKRSTLKMISEWYEHVIILRRN
jgi:hypothetical protein